MASERLGMASERPGIALGRLGMVSLMESWAMTGSSIGSVMFMWTMFQKFVPRQLKQYSQEHINKLIAYLYQKPDVQYLVHEFNSNGTLNNVFLEVEAYLGTKTSKTSKRQKVERGGKSKKLEFKMEDSERIYDDYQRIKLEWFLSKKIPSDMPNKHGRTAAEERRYVLTCNKKYSKTVTESYMEHVTKRGKEISLRNRQTKLYTNTDRYSQKLWSQIVFEHPATFQTIAMEPEKKQDIVDDLLAFANNEEFYSQIGRAWKRGYLLYGPPGTGKSTMIAAMANLLNYDIYDLELTAVESNSNLRKLLIETKGKSIIVIEDIDCSLNLTGQRKKKAGEVEEDSDDEKENALKRKYKQTQSNITLSGLLNFVDGLWSACGAERIIVFTTNYVENLDPALIRRGRMDKHIELSYCSFEAFKVLAKNYLRLETHPLFDKIENLINETKITPADVAENLMPTSGKKNTEKCLSNLIKALEEAKEAETMKLAKEAETMKLAKEAGTLHLAKKRTKKKQKLR